jgi:protein CpxP
MSRKVLAIIIAAFLVLIGVTAALAQHERSAWQKDPVGHMVAHMARKLDLTDAQQTQIKSIIEAERPNLQPLLQEMLQNHQQMVSVEKEGFDEAKVRSVATQQAQTIADLIVIKERIQNKIYQQVLTPDQRVKFDQMQQKRMDRMQQWLSKSAPAS